MKMNQPSNWYVITGSPSSGKTATLEYLAKKGYQIVPETARVLIDQEIEKGKTIKEIRKDEAKFQRNVLQMKIEIENRLPKNKIIFFDRAIPDSIAYFKLCGLDSKEVEKFCQPGRYKKVFFLEQLPLKKDYARTESQQKVKQLNRLLKESYLNLGYQVIDIPVASIKNRIHQILAKVNKKP